MYTVIAIPANPTDNLNNNSHHKSFYSAWKKHIHINYELLTICSWDNDYWLHVKVLLKSILGMETNWDDLCLSAEQCGTKIVKGKII